MLGRNVYASDKSEPSCVHSQAEARVCYSSEVAYVFQYFLLTYALMFDNMSEIGGFWLDSL